MNSKKVVVLNDTKTENHHGCSRVMDNLYHLINKNGGQVIACKHVSLDWRLDETLKTKIIASDIVIINGEGTIHHDSPHAIALIDAANYCKQYGKKVYLVNALFQGMSACHSWKMALFDGIFVRDSFSQKELASQGVSSQVIFDLTFYSKTIELDIESRHFGDTYTCSVMLEKTMQLYQASKKDGSRFAPIMFAPSSWKSPNKTIISKIKNHGLKSSFVKIMRKVEFLTMYRNLNIFTNIYTHDLYHRDIANTKFLISGRFHSVCFAINSLTPFVALKSNSHKVEALINDFGLNKERIVDDISDYNGNLRSFSDDERSSIHTKLEENRKKTEEFFQNIFA